MKIIAIGPILNAIFGALSLRIKALYDFSWSSSLILASLFLAQVLALVGMLWISNSATERRVQSQAKIALTQLIHLASTTTHQYLNNAGNIIDMQRRLIESGEINLSTPQKNLQFLHDIVRAAPDIDAIMIGEADGSFALAARNKKEFFHRTVLASQIIGKDSINRPQILDTRILSSGKKITTLNKIEKYDPRIRPWYALAKKARGKIVWTDPYVFASSGAAGITVAAMVYPPNEKPVVLAIDIHLTALSNMLQSSTLSPNAHTFIVDNKGNAVASSKKMPSVKNRVAQVKDFNNSALSDLIDFYRDNEYFTGETQYWHEYSSNKKDYVAMVQNIQIQEKINWIVGIYAPETTFTGALRDLAYKQHWLIVIIVLISNLVTWPIALQAVYSIWDLKRKSTTDMLTGLLNRSGFLERLEEEIRDSIRANEFLGVVMMDLDRFKIINDTYGHGAGDELLSGVAKTFYEYIDEEDVLGRLGGDEFALVIRGEDQEALVQRVRELIMRVQTVPINISEGDQYIGVTGGMAFLASQSQSSLDLLENADLCLISGKKICKGRLWTLEELDNSKGTHDQYSTKMNKIRNANSGNGYFSDYIDTNNFLNHRKNKTNHSEDIVLQTLF